jgi:molybdate transport system regulatory protein
MIDLHIFFKVAPDTRIGRGKIQLLEAVAATGSISAAARSLEMTYRRAWDLLDHMNKAFGQPLVDGHAGRTGGARLTDLGREVVARYRRIEAEARALAAPDIAALEAARVPPAADEGVG